MIRKPETTLGVLFLHTPIRVYINPKNHLKLTPIRARTVAICHVKAMSRTDVFHPNNPLYNKLLTLRGHTITNPLLSAIPVYMLVSYTLKLKKLNK